MVVILFADFEQLGILFRWNLYLVIIKNCIIR